MMKSIYRTPVLFSVLAFGSISPIPAQSSAIASLRARAHAQQQSGRVDLAVQTWQQVLLADPKDREALEALARAAKLAGHDADAAQYLNRLRHLDPHDPNIAAIQSTETTKVQNERLQQAAQLATQGHADAALRIYRRVWGGQPPDGDWALAYYDTEASIEAERTDAVEHLRALVVKYPTDQRYAITLGRILTYSPRTRPEGLRLLGRFPEDAAAQQALHQALDWNAASRDPEDEARHKRELQDTSRTTKLWAEVQAGTEALRADQVDLAIAHYKEALLLRPSTIEALNGLAGAYMRGRRPADAVPVYHQILKLDPESTDAWNSLFEAELQASQTPAAIETLGQLPATLKAKLYRDPASLRRIASLYKAGGQPEAATKALAQAAIVYRGLLYDNPEDIVAWQGLITLQHETDHDADAIATVERMAPATYEAALDEPDFPSLLAGIYQQQNRFDLAAALLQRAERTYATKGQPVPVALQLQVAGNDLQQNDSTHAYSIYREIVASHPENSDAWKGLISALHQTHRDRDALAELRQIPPNIRRVLDRDVEYNQAVAGIYAATGYTAAALQLIAQIQQFYRAKQSVAPADVDIQNAWLLYNTHDDRDLYRALMALGDRNDLSDGQRLSVENIWATWSVRRSGEAIDAGNSHRAIEILNVAAQAFPHNADVAKALASGYLKSGEPKRAMTIYAALDLANASAADYRSMVGAALAAKNLHQAELWLTEALDRFPNDADILAMAARFEQVRGDHARAADYWRASLAAAPQADPANRLAHALDQVDPVKHHVADASLTELLAPDSDAPNTRPALPSYRNEDATSSDFVPAISPLYGADPTLVGTAPVQLESAASTPAADSAAFAPPDLIGGGHAQPALVATDATEAPIRHRVDGRSSTLNSVSIEDATIDTRADAPPFQRQPTTSISPRDPEGPTPIPRQVRPTAPAFRFDVTPLIAWDRQYEQPFEQENLPPLRGPRSESSATPKIDSSDLSAVAEQQLGFLQSTYSPWTGASGYVNHRSGTPGFDQLYILESPFEGSTIVGSNARLTAIVTPSFLSSGSSTGTSTTFALGTLDATATPGEQNAYGVGGEGQLTTANFGIALGTTPRGFLLPNITGRVEIHPASSPFKFSFTRDAVKDSQLSYSGLRDPGSASATYAGNVWGGVVANAANVQFSQGDAASGYYAGVGGQYLIGSNVAANKRYDGVAGAYWKLATVQGSYELTVGANFFGMHYDRNLRYFTYGQGGYFSPNIYFLANVPFTLNGQYGRNLHYMIAGALGLQAFQEDATPYYPLLGPSALSEIRNSTDPADATRQAPGIIPPTPASFNNPNYAAQSVIGGNYDLHAEVSQQLLDHWYIGAYVALNNTRNYESQTVGFFLRHTSRSQYTTEEEGHSGLFPYAGQRPLLVP